MVVTMNNEVMGIFKWSNHAAYSPDVIEPYAHWRDAFVSL